MNRKVHFKPYFSGYVTPQNPVLRFPLNPILTPQKVNQIWKSPALQVTTVHNAGITYFDGQTIMLFRSHLKNGISVIGLAKSKDGFLRWNVAPSPVLIPANQSSDFKENLNPNDQIETESGGIEDPRINPIDNTFAITYSAYSSKEKDRVRVCIAQTEDFNTFTRLGAMQNIDMRNVVVFPEKIKGKYAALFRPNDPSDSDVGGAFTRIHLGYTTDWENGPWEINSQPVFKTGKGPGAFQDKIGPGAPPVKTDAGWINIFHGVRSTMDGNPYVLGVALHDLNDPQKVKVSGIPILFPSMADCKVNEYDYVHVPNVVFTCGLECKEDGTIIIYYGGNDTVMNCAATHRDILVNLCQEYGLDPISGETLYSLA
ncbi:hypothetical protein QA601_14505 [Chitinispirillales bacterium ANBcel5]|uniref:glycoside hydrolase family 130 protein n=1 Tax=Cellulosispirillum alkaliphilum TaxID=3039283 RepID=UPI002A50E767|nr:hypothetical protein [Chitinispirillales bacterium ANBcel5]